MVDRVAEKMSDAEVERRVEAILAGIELHKSTQKELKKTKPDQNTFNDEGEISHEGYSPELSEKRSKLKAKLGQIAASLQVAVKGRPQALYDLLDKQKKK